MRILAIILCLNFSTSAFATESRYNALSPDEAKKITYALDFYYTECGYYPQKLSQLFEAASKKTSGKPFLKKDSTTNKLISLLKYKPLKVKKHGPQSFNLMFVVVKGSQA